MLGTYDVNRSYDSEMSEEARPWDYQESLEIDKYGRLLLRACQVNLGIGILEAEEMV